MFCALQTSGGISVCQNSICLTGCMLPSNKPTVQSMALPKGMTVANICAVASWTSLCPFIHLYLQNMSESSLTYSLLNMLERRCCIYACAKWCTCNPTITVDWVAWGTITAHNQLPTLQRQDYCRDRPLYHMPPPFPHRSVYTMGKKIFTNAHTCRDKMKLLDLLLGTIRPHLLCPNYWVYNLKWNAWIIKTK